VPEDETYLLEVLGRVLQGEVMLQATASAGS